MKTEYIVSQGDVLPYEKHTRTLLRLKRFREALLVCLKWVEAQPENAAAWFFKGHAELNAHQPYQALASLSRATQLDPGNPLVLAQHAQALGAVGRTVDCLALAEKLLAHPRLPADLLHQIGSTLSNIGEHERAAELFQSALEEATPSSALYSSLATSLHILGRSDEAVAAHMESLKLDPKNFRTYWLLGQIAGAKPDSNYIELFEKVLRENPGSLQARICLNYALAKQYEELEEFDRAFVHLEAGAVGVLEHTPYKAESDRQMAEAIQKNFADKLFSQPDSHELGEEVLFIVGMPRTGTTLLEQIITTYPGLETAGELHHMTHLLNNAYSTINPNADFSNLYQGVERIDWESLGRAYIKRARVHVPESAVLIDKYPLNFLMLGAILKALPKARIINLQRNPMDTCFSNYKLLFRLGSALQTYDQVTMAEYYCRYQEFMSHWHDQAPGRILDVSYERLVTDSEAETRRVADYLGLDWNPACLEFYKSGSAVATASVSQVRRPIYSGSLYKWRKFQAHLQPMADHFRRHGVAIE